MLLVKLNDTEFYFEDSVVTIDLMRALAGCTIVQVRGWPIYRERVDKSNLNLNFCDGLPEITEKEKTDA